MGTLQLHSNGQLYSSTVIGTMAAELMGGLLYNPPINGQCTNFILFDVALYLPLHSKGFTNQLYVWCNTL